MESYKPSIKELFFAAWGAATLVFQIPVIRMILEEPQSLSLGLWDWKAFGLFSAVTFLAMPILVGFAIAGISRISDRLALWVLGIAAGYCLTMQVNFYYLQIHFMEAAWRKPVLAFLVLLCAAGLWRFRRTALALLKNCALLSGGLFLFFAFQTAPVTRAESYRAAPAVALSETNGPVFFLTFEKIAAPYVADEQGNILADRFPNLARFVSEADYYPQAFANSTGTIYSLKTLYSGRVVTLDRDWTRRPNLRDILDAAGRRVYVFLDLLTDYCDPGRNVCMRTIGRGRLNSLDFTIGWYKTYLMVLLPDPLERPLVKRGWHFNFWFDLWAKEAADLKPGEQLNQAVGTKQLRILQETVEQQGTSPNLYIMHSFISDGHAVVRLGTPDGGGPQYAKDLEEGRKNLAVFDREFGAFIDFLKEKGIYERSLILITADTGSDGGVTPWTGAAELPVYPDTSRVLLAIKRPGENPGRVFRSVFRHIDVLPTILADLWIDPAPYLFDGVAMTDPKEEVSIDQRPVDLVVTPGSTGLLYYRLDRSEGPFRRVR